jgi:type I restriction enzyme S subunit
MKLDTFFERFEQFADTPDAASRMRELLISFAIAGKLVRNDSREQPVALLLSGPPPDEVGVPPNWRCGLLGDVFTFEYGDNLPASKRTETGEYPVYGSNGIVGTHHTYLTKEPVIIVGRKGSAGALNIANGPSWTTDVAYFVRLPKDLDLRFTYYLFSRLRLGELGKGIKPGLSRKEAYALRIALPPVAEQKRIVAKLGELMALCDLLEKQQQELEMRRVPLARASLARFADAPNQANLDFLFHPSYAIPPGDLRKCILNLAVQGKLVPQDPNDESAEELLVRIAQKRTTLLKTGYPNRDEAATQLRKQETQVLPDGLAPLQPGWSWATLIQASLLVVDCHNKTAPYVQSGIRLLRTTNIRDGRLNLSEPRFVNDATYERWSARCKPEPGDVLITREAPMGEVCIIPTGMKVCLGQRMMLIRLVPGMMDGKYLLYSLMAPDLMERVQDKPVGATVQHLRVGGVETLLTPIPPLAEQHRIVAKVEQLMSLVDELEMQHTTARTKGAELVEAVVAELTASA